MLHQVDEYFRSFIFVVTSAIAHIISLHAAMLDVGRCRFLALSRSPSAISKALKTIDAAASRHASTHDASNYDDKWSPGRAICRL